MNGLKLAILYSLKPHELRLCGPRCVSDSKGILRRYFLGEKISEKIIRDLLNEFHGASDYYRLIARANGRQDHFDKKVVEAYWLGNRLLEKVSPDQIKKMILTDFVKPDFLSEIKAKKIAGKVPGGVVPHHSFHVFFVGSVTGRLKFNPALREVCRPGWGEVVEIKASQNKVIVKTRQLLPNIKSTKISLEWDKDLVPGLKRGDLISAHWGRVSQKINTRQLKNLIKYTMINFKAYAGNK